MAWLLFVRLPSRYEGTPAPSTPRPAAALRRQQGGNIKAQLFYLATTACR
jgi:hypothetical protein